MPYQVFQDNVQDTGDDGKLKVSRLRIRTASKFWTKTASRPRAVYVQDTWSDDAKTPKVDDKGQPTRKQADKIITDDDLKTKELPLPESDDSKFGKFRHWRGRPVPGL